MIEIYQAIKAINPNAEFKYTDNDYNTIEWLNDTTPISVDNIKAKQTELENDYDAKAYQRNRALEYKTIAEQLDMQYWDAVNGTTTWQDHINAIKTKYPKPE